MADQSAYPPDGPFSHFIRRPPYRPSWHISHAQANQFSNKAVAVESNGISSTGEQAKVPLRLIVEHPQFGAFIVPIKACLQLTEEIWQTYAQLRGNPVAKALLEPSQPALWHVPPDDIWVHIWILRQTEAFPSIQASVLGIVERAYQQSQQHAFDRQSQACDRNRSDYNPTAATGLTDPPKFLAVPAGTQTSSQDMAQTLQSRSLLHRTVQPGIGKNTNTRRGSGTRQAPPGYLYHCPSAGCKKTFTRQGHYKKHLNKTHPDFVSCHPEHSPQDTLKPKASSGSPDSCPRSTPRHPAGSAAGSYTNLSGLHNSLARRRGSHVSLNSFGSTSVTSSVFDDSLGAPTEPIVDMSDTGISMLPDPPSLWHVGGATLPDSMNTDSTSSFYTNVTEN